MVRGRSGIDLGLVWCWSGGGLTWVAQESDIPQLTRLKRSLSVRLSVPGGDNAGTAGARGVPDVDCVRHWNRVIYGSNSGGS
jgi:hypothetical protein